MRAPTRDEDLVPAAAQGFMIGGTFVKRAPRRPDRGMRSELSRPLR
jgi:hypothetical protein